MLKKFLLLLCSVSAFAQTSTATPNIGLEIPTYGSIGWSTAVNYNFGKLDQLLSGNASLPSLSVTGPVNLPQLRITTQQIQSAIGFTPLNPANNLSDIQNPNAALANLGGIGVSSYQGTWSSSTNYSRGQVVTYLGSSYMSLISPNIGNVPSTSTFNWGLLSGVGYTPLNKAGDSMLGPFTAPTINSEITVDGIAYPTLNAAWNAAVSAATATGKNQTIRLGPGTFPVTVTLTEPTNGACVSIIGSSSPAQSANVSAGTNITIPSSLSGDLIFIGNTAQAQGCTFRDLNILANLNATHAFELQYFRSLFLENVTVNDTVSDAFFLGESSGSHQSFFYARNITVSYSASSFTPATRPNYGMNLQSTILDSNVDGLYVRNALQAAVLMLGGGTTFNSIHGFGYPYTCSSPPCNNQETNTSAADASYASNYVVIDRGTGGNMYFNTYMDSPAIAAFHLYNNGVQINGGHIQWPETNSFPYASFAVVEASLTSNMVISNVDCLNMSSVAGYGSFQGQGVWISYLGASGIPPQYSTVDNLAGCGAYFAVKQSASQTGFERGAANYSNTNSVGTQGIIPKVWAAPLASASNYAAYAAQLYSGYQTDMYVGGFSGQPSIYNVTYQGTIHTAGGLQLGTVSVTSSTTLNTGNKNVLANASSGALTVTLPSCYTNMVDGVQPIGMEMTISKTDTSANAVTLGTTSSESIYYLGSGSSTFTLSVPTTYTLVCGSDFNWYVIAQSVPSITNLTGDVSASGVGSVNATVKGINGVTLSSLGAGFYKWNSSGVPSLAYVNTPIMTYGGSSDGSISIASTTTAAAANIWKVTAPITLTEFDVKTSGDASGCTTAPVIGLYDVTQGTWPVTLSLVSGQYFYYNSVPSVNIASGDILRLGVNTAGVGCTTTTDTIRWTLTYKMQ